MKLINEVSIWDNGVNKKATILNAYVVNLILNESATFYYGLSAQNEDGSIGETLTQGNLSMTGQDYQDWLIDNDAWDYIAKSLNLVITGDYVAPVAEVAPIEEVVVIEEPIVEEPTPEV
jgi:hypothetical protein